jgi:23S rRNA (cytosine1962-C5)-methyltransferase
MQAAEVETRLRLKKGKERPLLQRHHWIFSGAIAELTSSEPGSIAEVYSHERELIGLAMIGTGHSIVGHMLAFGSETASEALRSRISAAVFMRKTLFDTSRTNAFRLINAEGDGLPGLIVDSYNGVLVIQFSHPTMEVLKAEIVSLLIELALPRAIYEKSTSFLRKKEGMEEIRAHLYGQDIPEVEVLENGLAYSVQVLEGQKTGLFLDQREMRSLVRDLSRDKRVLNCFAYTGGFSVSALAGGALQVDSVEISKKCEPLVSRNLELNQLPLEAHRFFAEDAIKFVVHSDLKYDLVILDPPAFVKKKQDIDKAFRAYKDMNRAAIQKMGPGTLLLTCSCSYHVGEELFQNILFRAALEANRNVRILSKHRQALDHPISIYHPESSYLKSFLLYIE